MLKVKEKMKRYKKEGSSPPAKEDCAGSPVQLRSHPARRTEAEFGPFCFLRLAANSPFDSRPFLSVLNNRNGSFHVRMDGTVVGIRPGVVKLIRVCVAGAEQWQ